MLKINKRIVRRVPVEVKQLRWFGPLADNSAAAGFRCSACGRKLGARTFAAAWIRDGDQERSMRLCEDCGKAAEQC